jgi:diaminopimelate epimerase
MNVRFVKMVGAGNDMILIDHREGFLRSVEREFVRAACDRRHGVGADAVVLLENDATFDFSVRFFNPDGGEYALCGNGARCVPAFAEEIGLKGPSFTFRSSSGVHRGEILSPTRARIALAPVRRIRLDVPILLHEIPARAMDWGDIGVPHACVWVEDVAGVPISEWGPRLRRHPAFAPEGTNVSFVERLPSSLKIRTFERGVEGETLACGSGSAVVATIARARGFTGDEVRLIPASGEELTILLPREEGDAPLLEGPVRRAFDGVLDLETLLQGSPEIR